MELRNLQSDEIDSVYKSNAILRYTKAAIQTPILALPYGNYYLFICFHKFSDAPSRGITNQRRSCFFFLRHLKYPIDNENFYFQTLV